jgi:hypothetical protein
VTSFFHPDARLINPLMRVQGREMVYRLYRCATVFNHPRAAVHKVGAAMKPGGQQRGPCQGPSTGQGPLLKPKLGGILYNVTPT